MIASTTSGGTGIGRGVSFFGIRAPAAGLRAISPSSTAAAVLADLPASWGQVRKVLNEL